MFGKGFAQTVGLIFGLSSAAAVAGFGDLLKQAEGFLNDSGGTSAATSSLTDGQINDGLKEALSIGAERAVALLGKDGGFLNDPAVQIPLPGVLKTAGKALRSIGQGKYVDQFETTVNRAAEAAVPETLEIVKKTVQDMTLEDVRGILTGGDDSATQFLRKRAGESLHEVIKPIVTRATEQAGATAAYKGLKAQADQTLGGLVSTESMDLDNYVTDKTLDGLFLKLAAEEKAIRENPLARSTDLLKQVFAN